jgi:hypothetical protein
VERVEHNPITGGILVHYVPGQIDADEIINHVAESSGLAVSETPATDPADLPKLIIEKSRDLNAIVEKLTGFRADVRSVIPIALASLAGYSLVKRKDRLPSWDNLAYWAFAIFTELHKEEISAPSPPEGSRAREGHGLRALEAE